MIFLNPTVRWDTLAGKLLHIPWLVEYYQVDLSHNCVLCKFILCQTPATNTQEGLKWHKILCQISLNETKLGVICTREQIMYSQVSKKWKALRIHFKLLNIFCSNFEYDRLAS